MYNQPWKKTFPVAKRRLGVDVAAWITALILVLLVSNALGLVRIELWWVLPVVALAAVLQMGVGLIQGVYTEASHYPATVHEFGAVARAAGATTALLVVVNFCLTPRFLPMSIILAGGALALGLIGISRFVWCLNTRRQQRMRPVPVREGARVPLAQALAVAGQAVGGLKGCNAVLHCACAGSVRRMWETVGDIDLVAASDCPAEVVDAFFSLIHGRREWKAQKREWQTHVRVLTPDGIQIELWVVPPSVYAAALVSKSGARTHNEMVWRLALKLGRQFSLGRAVTKNYWFFLWTTARLETWGGRWTEEDGVDVLLHLREALGGQETEEAIYECLGMQWIPPTLREGCGEVELALEGRLPRVVELSKDAKCGAGR